MIEEVFKPFPAIMYNVDWPNISPIEIVIKAPSEC